jgi:hypothetical protein
MYVSFLSSVIAIVEPTVNNWQYLPRCFGKCRDFAGAKKRGARETHARRSFLLINLSCTSGITSLVNWSVDWFDYKIIFVECK